MLAFRRVWVTFWNLVFLAFVSFGLFEDYRLYQLSDPTKRPGSFNGWTQVLLIVLLLAGLTCEWLDRIWFAVTINAGFFAFLGIAVLSKPALMSLTHPGAQYDPEGVLTVAIVGIPCAAIACTDVVLYWLTRHPTLR